MKIEDYQKFLINNYPIVLTKNRSRSTSMEKRMIINFLRNEINLKKYTISHIFNNHHSSINNLCLPVIDKEYENYFKGNIEELRQKFKKFSHENIRIEN